MMDTMYILGFIYIRKMRYTNKKEDFLNSLYKEEKEKDRKI